MEVRADSSVRQRRPEGKQRARMVMRDSTSLLTHRCNKSQRMGRFQRQRRCWALEVLGRRTSLRRQKARAACSSRIYNSTSSRLAIARKPSSTVALK